MKNRAENVAQLVCGGGERKMGVGEKCVRWGGCVERAKNVCGGGEK